VPVYFAYETDTLTQLYATLKENAKTRKSDPTLSEPRGIRRVIGSSEAEHLLILTASDPKPLASINLDVFYGQLNFKEAKDLVQLND